MKRWLLLVLVGLALAPGHARSQSVPGLVSFTARLFDEGEPVDGEHTFIFRLYDAETGGSVVWNELQPNVAVDDGMVYLALGAVTPLDATVLAGAPRWLEVTVDAVALEPRLPLQSAPYAIRAGTAVRAEGLTNEGFSGSGLAPTAARSDHGHEGVYMPAISASCPAGQYVSGINANGTLACTPIRDYVNQNCFVYYGWRDNCDGCTDPPLKFGRVSGNNQCTVTGGDSSCITPTLNGVVVPMLGINPDGDVNDDDKLYLGLKCF
jgi:hypothetical protein